MCCRVIHRRFVKAAPRPAATWNARNARFHVTPYAFVRSFLGQENPVRDFMCVTYACCVILDNARTQVCFFFIAHPKICLLGVRAVRVCE